MNTVRLSTAEGYILEVAAELRKKGKNVRKVDLFVAWG
jgi:hypothetical protein